MVVLDPIQRVPLVAFRLMLLADVILAVTAVRGTRGTGIPEFPAIIIQVVGIVQVVTRDLAITGNIRVTGPADITPETRSR